MNRTGVLGFLFACVLVASFAWAAWYFVLAIQEADANVKAGIIGLLGMFLAAILTNFFTRRREINARHFSEKREAYAKFIDIVFSIVSSINSGRNLSEQSLANKIMGFKKELMVWGGPEVIQSWNDFEIQSEKVSEDPKDILSAVERLLRAIRKDLGHDDRRLKFGSLLGLLMLAKDKKVLYGNDN